MGFAKAHGVTVEDLQVASLPKGPYVVARKVTPGRPANEVIGEILPPLVEKMTFPRMMRWGDGTPQWIRPVHSVLALFDGLVIPMTLFGVESGRTTHGHRTLAPGRIVTTGVSDWFQKLRAAHVEPDLAVRRARLEEQARALAAEVGGEPADDAALLDTWAHLVEAPGVVRGSFDAGLPRAAGGDPRHVDARAPEDAAGARGRPARRPLPRRLRPGGRPEGADRAGQRVGHRRALFGRALLLGRRREDEARGPPPAGSAGSSSRRRSATI